MCVCVRVGVGVGYTERNRQFNTDWCVCGFIVSLICVAVFPVCPLIQREIM